MFVRPLVFILG